MSKTDVKETRGNIQNKLKNKEMSRNIISDYMLGLQARADTSSADIIADIINPQHSTTHDGVWMTIIRPLMFPVTLLDAS